MRGVDPVLGGIGTVKAREFLYHTPQTFASPLATVTLADPFAVTRREPESNDVLLADTTPSAMPRLRAYRA
jgi:spermidine synthase